MTENIKDVAGINIVDDIADLARKLSEKEPFKSGSGPEALRAFAMHLEGMVSRPDQGITLLVNVAVQSRHKKSA